MMLAAVGEPVERRPGETLGAEDLRPGLEGQIARDDQARALIGGRDDVEEQLGTDLGGRDVAQFVQHEQVQPRELGLQAQEAPLVPRLDEGGHELGGAEEAHPVAALAGHGRQRRRQMAFAGAGVADHQKVLALVDPLTARQLGDEHLVHRRPGGEVEGLERLQVREASLFQPSLGRV